MPRNGAGSFVLVPGNPVVTNTTISSAWANNTMSDLASGLTQSIAKDGQTVATANLPMGGFKHTNVAPAVQDNEYATLAQVQGSTSSYLVGVSGGDTITANGAPLVTAYTAGNNYRFKAVASNTSSNVTINIDSVGAIPLIRNDGKPLSAGGIANGEVIEFTYDGTNGIITSTSNSLADGGTAGSSRASGLQNLLPPQSGKSGQVLTSTTNLYTSTTRARASNIATIGITPTSPMPSLGDQVIISGLPSAYNGTKVVIAVGVGTISYNSTGSDESVTADTAGVINNYVADFTSPSSGKIQSITASVGSNALTITLNPTALDFRDATLGSGTVNARTVPSAISVVVSSGSTLGTVNAVQNRLAVLAIDNAGTVELAVVNLAGGVNLDETGVISTTAEGGAGGADSENVIYSTTARTNVPYRVVGFVESTQATAGTWATAPSKIQGYGGQAFAAMSSLGYGQTWQDVTASRAVSTTYTNTTGKPIFISIYTASASNGNSGDITVNGVVVSRMAVSNTVASAINATAIIPPGATYSYGPRTFISWLELR